MIPRNTYRKSCGATTLKKSSASMSSCAAADARPRVCVRSTMKKRRPSSFTRIPRAFYCFGCGAAGDVINFVRKYNNLGYVEAVKQLAGRAGMPLPEEDDRESRARQRLLRINRCAARYFYENLNAKTPEAAMARRYWKEKRGLSDAAIRRFGLGYAPEDFGGLLHHLKRRGFGGGSWKPPASSSAAPRATSMTSSATASWCPSLMCAGAIIAFGGRVLDDSKPKYINSPETMVYHKSRTFLH